MSTYRSSIAVAIIAMAFPAAVLSALDIKLDIVAARWELRPGLTTTVWSYNGQVPGSPIVVNLGETVVIQGTNRLQVPTNIHWHGLVVPNDQDGPGKVIQPGETFRYQFKVEETGTYWYHSHQRPVLPQVDRGLYGSFVVRVPEDARYSGDHTLVLDDWYLDATGRRIEGTAQGDMERYGNVETVNGKTGDAIEPLVFQKGEIHKLRFINASTAAVHELRVTGHRFRVTHTDGHALTQPYIADVVRLAPGERLDVEVEAAGAEGQTYTIASARAELGIRIPVTYRAGSRAQVASPFVAPPSRAFPGAKDRLPDYVLDLNSSMGMGGMGGMDHGGMSMGGTSAAGMMSWTINGVSFPETEPLFVKTGELVKVRMRNRDTGTGMQHPMDHPMHIHGAFFQVVSLNGRDPERETWKDTIVVPAGEYVDVAFIMKYPGQWMFHCHVIDHEDAGMMTMVEASP